MSKTPPPVAPRAQPAAARTTARPWNGGVSAAVAALLGAVPQSASAGAPVRLGEGMWRDRDRA